MTPPTNKDIQELIDLDKARKRMSTKHEAYRRIANDLAELLIKKNAAYGDSFDDTGKILATLYPNGIDKEQYDDVLYIARIIDKLFRIATDKNALGERPFKDIAGYSILGEYRHEQQNRD